MDGTAMKEFLSNKILENVFGIRFSLMMIIGPKLITTYGKFVQIL